MTPAELSDAELCAELRRADWVVTNFGNTSRMSTPDLYDHRNAILLRDRLTREWESRRDRRAGGKS